MNTNEYRKTAFVALAIVLLASQSGALLAQVSETDRAAVTQKLQAVMNVSFRNARLGDVASDLSKTLGVEIVPADYLKEHLVSIYSQNLTGLGLLDAICDLNDWSWRVTAPGKVSMSRHVPEFDRTVQAIPRRIQAAIPRDLRTYLGTPTPGYDLHKENNTLVTGLMNARRGNTDRLARIVAEDQSDLLTGLGAELKRRSKLRYSDMSPDRQQELVVSLLFPILRQTSYELLHGDLLPHAASVENAFLKLFGGNALMVGSRVSDGKTDTEVGFGALLDLPATGAATISGK